LLRHGLRITGLVLLVLATGCAVARKHTADGWQVLGARTVDGRADHDQIPVGPNAGPFQQIQFTVSGSALDVYGLQVTFGDGETFSPPLRLRFHKGGWSRIVDLPGSARMIRKVEFRYGNATGGSRAHVRLLAR